MRRGRTLLVLDTAAEDGAAWLYERLGFTLAGEIPDYALKPHGGLTGTMIYWKRIGARRPARPWPRGAMPDNDRGELRTGRAPFVLAGEAMHWKAGGLAFTTIAGLVEYGGRSVVAHGSAIMQRRRNLRGRRDGFLMRLARGVCARHATGHLSALCS